MRFSTLLCATVLSAVSTTSAVSADASDDPVARRVDDDDKRTYFLLTPEEYDGKRKLHLVLAMPGGNGQARDFLPWMTTVREGLGDDHALAVLSAPRWNEEQAKNVVWVTEYWKKKSYPEAEFSTEEFLHDVLADIERAKEVRIDTVTVFGWSSSGPAVYAAATEKKVPYDGFLILSSVFKPDQTRGLSKVKGRRFYLLQGEKDEVTALRWAEQAQEALEAKKAVVRLEAFPGGHGFAMEDPIGSLRTALEWLRSKER